MFDKNKLIVLSNKNSNSNVLDEKFFKWLYDEISNDRMGDMFFYSIGKNKHKSGINFIKWSMYVNFYLSLYDGEPALVSWVTQIKPRFGSIDYFVFNKFRRNLSAEITKETLHILLKKYWDIIIGFSPSENKPGLNFLDKLGMQVIGRMNNVKWWAAENKYTDYIVSYKCKGDIKDDTME